MYYYVFVTTLPPNSRFNMFIFKIVLTKLESIITTNGMIIIYDNNIYFKNNFPCRKCKFIKISRYIIFNKILEIIVMELRYFIL